MTAGKHPTRLCAGDLRTSRMTLSAQQQKPMAPPMLTATTTEDGAAPGWALSVRNSYYPAHPHQGCAVASGGGTWYADAEGALRGSDGILHGQIARNIGFTSGISAKAAVPRCECLRAPQRADQVADRACESVPNERWDFSALGTVQGAKAAEGLRHGPVREEHPRCEPEAQVLPPRPGVIRARASKQPQQKREGHICRSKLTL